MLMGLGTESESGTKKGELVMRVRSCSGEDLEYTGEALSCIGALILLLLVYRNKTGNFGRRVFCRISTAISPGRLSVLMHHIGSEL